MSRSGIEGPSQRGPLPHLASKAVGERRGEFRAHTILRLPGRDRVEHQGLASQIGPDRAHPAEILPQDAIWPWLRPHRDRALILIATPRHLVAAVAAAQN